mgnify:CR=1 FL=1
MKKHTTDTTPEETTTPKKLLKIRMEVSAGKITRLEISMAPIIRIPRTIEIAVRTAIRRLKADTRPPVAYAKLSSHVTATT